MPSAAAFEKQRNDPNKTLTRIDRLPVANVVGLGVRTKVVVVVVVVMG